MIKYLFKRDTILATVMVFVVMALLALIPINTHVLDPIKMALQDFDYNDLAYSQFDKNAQSSVDTNTVIVNIGDADRAAIASLIKNIAGKKPAVIGVDVLFNEPKDATADSTLSQLFGQTNNIVLAYNLDTDQKKWNAAGFLVATAKASGYANFVGEEGGSIRHTAPFITKDGTRYQSFGAAVAQAAYPQAYQQLLKRNNATEQVNYTRTTDKFLVVEGDELFADSALVLAGKTVLLGYISADPNSIEDKHFTPFNKKSVGKTVPDMEGVFVHANIIGMIRERAYVHKSPVWINWFIASLLCWLHMSLFIRFFLDKHLWFHLVAKIAQVVSAILFVYLGLLFYYKWDVKINLSPTFVAIILAVDVLYFYEAISTWLHRRFGVHSLFIHSHH